MIREKIQQLILMALQQIWPDRAGDWFKDSSEIVIEKPAHADFGDYAISAPFRIGKLLKQAPQEIANTIKASLEASSMDELEKIEVAGGGFLNLFLKKEFLQKELINIYKDLNEFGKSNLGKGRKVIVEYPSTNIAKPMHYGHSRTAFIGDALSNIYQFLNYHVIRWDYIGDWGTAFGKVIAAYKLWGDRQELEAKPIETLLNLYVRFSAEAKSKPELDVQARQEFHKLEEGDQENLDLWQWFKDESLKESSRIYGRLGLNTFDVTIGESFYDKDMKPLIEELTAKGIAEVSEGAVIVKLDDDKLPPALLQKSDGASLYLTRDIANIRYRSQTYQPSKILYVVANQQALHFEQLFAVARIMGLTTAEMTHIKYGMVLGEDHKKLATREGKVISLEDILNEAVRRARAVVDEKNPDLDDAERQHIAQVVAVGALKYNDLKEYRTSDIVFDWDRVLDFTGNSGPYLQYTYARIASILAKGGPFDDYNASLLTEKAELNLMKELLEFPEAVLRSCQTDAPNHLALYLYELANKLNIIYETIPVLKDTDQARRNSRLMMIYTGAQILKKGLALLGIQTLEKI